MEYLSKLDQMEARYDELSRQMADPAVINDSEKYRAIAKEHREQPHGNSLPDTPLPSPFAGLLLKH